MKEKIKLAIVDDSDLYRNYLATNLQQHNDLDIIIKSSNGGEFIDSLESGHEIPDVILLDLEMPVMNGFKTLEYLSEHYLSIKILILTGHNDEDVSHRLIQQGAHGFLVKNEDTSLVLEAIYAVTKYHYYFKGWDLRKKSAKKLNDTFLPKEVEVIKLIYKEKTNKEISERLHMSKRTVDGYRERIYKKADVSTTVGLVKYVVKNLLISPDEEE